MVIPMSHGRAVVDANVESRRTESKRFECCEPMKGRTFESGSSPKAIRLPFPCELLVSHVLEMLRVSLISDLLLLHARIP